MWHCVEQHIIRKSSRRNGPLVTSAEVHCQANKNLAANHDSLCLINNGKSGEFAQLEEVLMFVRVCDEHCISYAAALLEIGSMYFCQATGHVNSSLLLVDINRVISVRKLYAPDKRTRAL